MATERLASFLTRVAADYSLSAADNISRLSLLSAWRAGAAPLGAAPTSRVVGISRGRRRVVPITVMALTTARRLGLAATTLACHTPECRSGFPAFTIFGDSRRAPKSLGASG